MKAAILANQLIRMSGDLDVYIEESSHFSPVESVRVEPHPDSRCQCGHHPERHKLTVVQRMDRLLGNRTTGDLGACVDCECEKYQRNEKKVVVLS